MPQNSWSRIASSSLPSGFESPGMAAMIAGRAVGLPLAMFSGVAVAAVCFVYLLAPESWATNLSLSR